MEDIYADALRGLLEDCCTLRHVREIEAGGPAGALWEAIEGSGFANALLPESVDDGAGLTPADAFALLELCGRFAVPVPLAETMTARALLARAGVRRPGGSIALATGRLQADGALHGERVVFGRVADWVLVQVEGSPSRCLLLPVDAAEATPAVAPLDASLRWSAEALAAAPSFESGEALRLHQARLIAAQLAGALSAVFERTLQYANERQQFGRAIGKFQAIQHQLSVMAEHVFAARMAAQMGCTAGGAQPLAPDALRVAVAKARTSEAALEVAALSHSIHGAIGFTAEFDLQVYTRRLHAWRQAAGAESHWHDLIGTLLVDGRFERSLDLLRAATDPVAA
jgi:acyl-CoA dehydrogenase